MNNRSVKIIVTLGPSTNSEKCLKIIKDKGVDFVRVNMSHSSIDDLDHFLHISKSVGIAFILDTEGSQIRTGALEKENIYFNEYQMVKIFKDELVGNSNKISIKPGFIVNSLQEGDLLHIGFDALTLQIIDSSTIKHGYIIAMVISNGDLGMNKAVFVDPRFKVSFDIPPLTSKDFKAIELGLSMGVKHIAVSYVRSAKSVDIVRKATQNKMAVISKIECVEALQNLDAIIKNSDYLLLDRGDLSKEIPIRKIPFIQKIIISKARDYNKSVFIATNLLESMIEKQNPTRAEVHDVIISILDGAEGLTLAAETAIGKHPLKCINILNELINHVDSTIDLKETRKEKFKYYNQLESSGYLLDTTATSLVSPHGGKLIDRYREKLPMDNYLENHTKIKLEITKQIEIEQIATGVFSPLEGFMNEDDFHSVVERLQLSNGEIWPLPIVLDVTEKEADTLRVGEDVALANTKGETFAVLHLETKYRFNNEKTAEKIYGTCSGKHPGVKMIKTMKPILLSGKIDLISWRKSPTMGYELTPKQTRKLFEEKGWMKIVGFHTRNIPHKGHEFILRSVFEDECCDGVFIHPVVGKKKDGDFSPIYILKSYEKLIKRGFLLNKIILAAFPTFSRYAGPREAVFTAICRKNYGCSHFIVGRDHTGTGNFFDHFSSHEIFNSLPNLGIKIIKVDEVVYSKGLKKYFFQKDYPRNNAKNKAALSGTLVRDYFLAGAKPPDWLMEAEIAQFILEALAKNEQVFIKS